MLNWLKTLHLYVNIAISWVIFLLQLIFLEETPQRIFWFWSTYINFRGHWRIRNYIHPTLLDHGPGEIRFGAWCINVRIVQVVMRPGLQWLQWSLSAGHCPDLCTRLHRQCPAQTQVSQQIWFTLSIFQSFSIKT